MSVFKSAIFLALFTITFIFASAQVVTLPDSLSEDGEELLHDTGWRHWGFDPADLPHYSSHEEHDVSGEGGSETDGQEGEGNARRSVEAGWSRCFAISCF